MNEIQTKSDANTTQMRRKTNEVVATSPVKFDESAFKINRVIEDKDGKTVEINDFKAEFRTNVGKCKVKACRAFDVPLDVLEKAVTELNGRRIDGVLVNDLIGRYGFYTGVGYNRADVAVKSKTTVLGVEIAHDKLKSILHAPNLIQAYKNYMDEYKSDVTRKLDAHVSVGDPVEPA